jgi:hypothetical protein
MQKMLRKKCIPRLCDTCEWSINRTQ